MPIPFLGELAALGTAVCWTVTSLAFQAAGRRVGSLVVNLLRLGVALVPLALWGLALHGRPLPTDAGAHQWLWLSLSGLVGFTFGDLCLFRALVVVGARLSMLLMALVPPLTALLGWIVLGERLTAQDLAGMALTLSGVAWVVAEHSPDASGAARRAPTSGVLLGIGGAAGQAIGLVLSKHGMQGYDPFAATQIRVIAGFAGFALLFAAIGWWPKVPPALRDRRAMGALTIGAVFGPFLGVSLSLVAVRHALAGVAATLMSLVPVLILVPTVLVYRERVSARAAIGSAIAVAGSALLFLGS